SLCAIRPTTGRGQEFFAHRASRIEGVEESFFSIRDIFAATRRSLKSIRAHSFENRLLWILAVDSRLYPIRGSEMHLLRWLRGGTEPDDVRPGESFRRGGYTRVAEIATVQGLRHDLLGIPHVLFRIAFECSDSKRFEEESRTLALDSFLNAYPERVS